MYICRRTFCAEDEKIENCLNLQRSILRNLYNVSRQCRIVNSDKGDFIFQI